MKPRADEEDILTGREAVDHVLDTWENLGMGLVNVEFHTPWLIVRRGGGDYSAFISVVDDTAVTILEDDATPRHIPKDLRPDAPVTDDMEEKLVAGFNATSGGSFPIRDEEVFAMRFKDGDGHNHKSLKIGLLDDRLEVVDD